MRIRLARSLGTAALMALGCTVVEASEPPTETVVVTHEPTGVYVVERVIVDPTPQIPDAVGAEVLSDGSRVDVVVYVHTYPDPIEVYPHVWWAGRWYYNVHGNLVFWDPFFGGWAYYWGPPVPLVTVWNHHHPDVVFAWGVGYYGPGWYWGGVATSGWHAHGHPPPKGEAPIRSERPRPRPRPPANEPSRTERPSQREQAQPQPRAEPQPQPQPRVRPPPAAPPPPPRARPQPSSPQPQRARPQPQRRPSPPRPAPTRGPRPGRSRAR